MKKTAILLLTVFCLVAMLPYVPTMASSKTANDAIDWVKSQVGHSVGYDDGSGYYQCVEFIQAYYQFLGVNSVRGNGADYATNALPSGWTRTAGGTPQKGDILVYSAYSSTKQQYGHVAIYESDNVLYDQDGSVYGATVKKENKNYKTYTYNYWGCIHPDFAVQSVSPTVLFSAWENSKFTYIKDKDASIGQQIDVYDGTCTEAGMYLYNQNGDFLGKAGGGYYYRVYFKISEELGVTLSPGTPYKYKFYAIVNGKAYWSNEGTFNTSGTTEISSVSLNASKLSLKPGESYSITASVLPDYATNKTVTWSSSNTSVATISNGKVTAVAAGTSTITAKAGNKSATCSITVYNPTVEVSGLSLNKTSLSLVTGGTETLSATVTPSNATNKTVTWSSSNTSVATVSNGKVTAVGAGTATITAKAGNKSATCSVAIKNPIVEVSGISLNSVSISLAPGETETLTATVIPSNATNKTVTWSSSNTGVATISNGIVTAVAVGNATITAKSGSKSVTCSVTVYNPTVEVLSVALDKTSLSMVSGDTESLNATLSPANATNKTISWSSSNPAVVTVDGKGTITAVAAGTATITAKAESKSATCYVTVSDPIINVASVVLSNSNLSLSVGDSEYLYATVYPLNASEKDVTWWSSDYSVAGVENGYITAFSAGTAVITAQAGSKLGYCTVTVSDKSNVEAEDKNKEASLVTIGDDSEEEDLYEEEDEPDPEPIGTVFTDGKLNYIVTDYDEVCVKGVKGSQTKIVVPSEITYNGFEYYVYGIQKNAFKKNSKLKSVTIEADLDYIGESAFEGCKALTTLSIKGDVLKICKKAFYNCKKLKTISILTDSLEKVESRAFSRINENASVKALSSMVTEYKALLKKGGFTAKKVSVAK